MRSTVAVVGARPETVGEDYARLLSLVGKGWREGAADEVVLTVEAAAWPPGAGAGTPPWQLDGVVSALADAGDGWRRGGRVALGRGADLAAARRGYGWQRVLEERQAELVSLVTDEWHEIVAPVASWTGFGEEVPRLPGILLEKPVVSLTAARTDGITTVGGAVAAGWRDLVPAPTASLRRHRARVLADLLGLRRQLHAGLLAVTDATVFGLGPSPADLRPVLSHVLLASADPVALDATVVRWLGRDPATVAHLRACAERGIGRIAAADIRVVGEPELLDRAPGMAESAAAGVGLPPRVVRNRWLSRVGHRLRTTRADRAAGFLERCDDLVGLGPVRRHRRWRRFATTAWGRLWAHYTRVADREVAA